MKLCACRKGCKKEVKGKGLYALGHHPESNQGRMPQVLRKLKARFEIQRTNLKSYVWAPITLSGRSSLGCSCALLHPESIPLSGQVP